MRFHRRTQPKEGPINGDQAARATAELIATSRKEGWDPIYSIGLTCVQCSSTTSIGLGSDTFVFVYPDGSKRMDGLDESLECGTCRGSTFLLTVEPRTLREVLKDALANLEATQQDPGSGFREDATGAFIVDRTLAKASGFDVLWNRIAGYMDLQGYINVRHGFDMIDGRYLEGRIPAILHYNDRTSTAVTILRDRNDDYWYSVER